MSSRFKITIWPHRADAKHHVLALWSPGPPGSVFHRSHLAERAWWNRLLRNNFVWRQITFSPVTATKIRVLVTRALDTWSRVAELEAYGTPAGTPSPTNVALAANGASATASSTLSSGYDASGTINGDRRGQPWGAGGGWDDGTPNDWTNDWLQITFNGSNTISEIDVFSVQDNYQSPVEPTPSQTFSLYGLRDFRAQYWNGATWIDIPGASVTGNNLVWRQFAFLRPSRPLRFGSS